MKEYNINLSTDNFANVNTDIKIKQNDFNSALFLISCDVEFTSAILKFKLPGKSVIVSENYSLTEGVISYCIENSVLSEYGLIVCEVSYYKDNQRITTNTFTFEVIEEINTSFSVKSDNDLQILDSLITKTENILNTAKSIAFSMPCETSSGRFAYAQNSNGVKKSLKIYGNNTSPTLICSDANNMLEFIGKDVSSTDTSGDYYEIKDKKIYVNNLIADEIALYKNNFGSYFKINPITLYKGIPYTVTTSENNPYPYLMLYDESYKLFATVSINKIIIPEEDVTLCYARLWSNFTTAGMAGYRYDGFYDMGIYIGEYSINTIPENIPENRLEIAIPQMADDSYIYVDNTSAIIYENEKITDISKTEIGKKLISLMLYKEKCYVYCTNNLNIELCYYKDILKILDNYQLKEQPQLLMMSPRPQNNIITEIIPE